MSKEEGNKAVVGRWFTEVWGKDVNLAVVDEIAAPNMLLKYSLHEPRRGRADIKAFTTDFRTAFFELNFWGTADLIARATMSSAGGRAAEPITGSAFKDFLWRSPSRDGSLDAVHRHDGFESDRRQNRRRGRT
jgi:hypothetical protein